VEYDVVFSVNIKRVVNNYTRKNVKGIGGGLISLRQVEKTNFITYIFGNVLQLYDFT
jgi:hypothetical protein